MKANPSPEAYAKAREVVSGWMASLHETTRAAIPDDDGGQLLDTLAWEFDALLDRMDAALIAADREYATVRAESDELFRLLRQRAGADAAGGARP